jgi:hypothetical protein
MKPPPTTMEVNRSKLEARGELEAGGKLEAGGSCWRRTGGEIKREKKINKTKGKKVFRPDYIYRPKQAETGRNGRNRPK